MADLACDLGAQGQCSCRGGVSALEDDALLLASVMLWLFVRTQVFNPESSLRNVHVEALRVFLNRTFCGCPYTIRNNMENPYANCFG